MGLIRVKPIIDTKEINEFEKQFGIDRNEPLSVVIPAVTAEITPVSLIAAVLREYFWAIVNQKLIVEVTHEDGASHRYGQKHYRNSLKITVAKIRILPKVELAVEAKQLMSINSRKVFRGLGTHSR